MSGSHVDRVRSFYEATAEGDVRGALSVCAEDVEWTEAEGFPYAGTYRGVEEVLREVFVPLGEDWERFGSEPERFVADGDVVVVLGTYSGTHAETGESFEARFAHVWEFEDGEAVAFEQVTDTALVQDVC